MKVQQLKTLFLPLMLCAGFFLGFNGQALADTLPLGNTYTYSYLVDLSANVCAQGGQNSASCSLSGASSQAIANNGTGGLASVSLGSNATYGLAETAYYGYISGPTNVNVPLVINGMASTTDNGSQLGASYAAYYMYDYNFGTTGLSYVSDFFASPTACGYLQTASIPCTSTGNFTLNTTVSSDSVFYVVLWAYAGGTNASALIDPTISIDPSFAQASQFTVVANAGVLPTPTSSVPEPASAVLLIAALPGVFLLGKHLRAKLI